MIRDFLQRHKTILSASVLSLPMLYISFVGLKHRATSTEAFSEIRDGSPVHLADLENQSINESSGIAASRRNTDILWTHNDSGDGPFVYAFDRRGKHRGVWRVAGADAQDWEDMAIGPGAKQGSSYLYLGDIGDNSKKRDQIIVYRVAEPQVTSADSSSTKQSPRETEAAEVIRMKYPDGKHDAESLLVHPKSGDLYVVTKVMGKPAGVYKLKAPFSGSGQHILASIGEFSFPNQFIGFITGGDISPEGRRVALCDYLGACELVLPEKSRNFDDIWKQSPMPIDIGSLKTSRRQGEAICYRADGRAVLATSEGRPCPLIEFLLTK